MHAERRRRKGSVAIEMLLVFPLLLAVLLATIVFALWLSAQQQVALASREGARTAAIGGSAADVQASVRLALGDSRFAQASVQANLTDGNGVPLPSGQPVSVVVQLPAAAAVPDLLVFIGVSVRNQTLVSQTVMRKE